MAFEERRWIDREMKERKGVTSRRVDKGGDELAWDGKGKNVIGRTIHKATEEHSSPQIQKISVGNGYNLFLKGFIESIQYIKL